MRPPSRSPSRMCSDPARTATIPIASPRSSRRRRGRCWRSEGRRNAGSDSGDIDLLLKRSFDHGKTWTKAQVLADFGGDTIGNPAPVVDQKTGAILLLLTRNPGDVIEKQIL